MPTADGRFKGTGLLPEIPWHRNTEPQPPEGFCFECGGVTDDQTGGVFCCHQCRSYLRESESL